MEMSGAWRSRNTGWVLVLTLALGGTAFWAWMHYSLRPPERPLRIALTHSPPFAYVYANGSVGLPPKLADAHTRPASGRPAKSFRDFDYPSPHRGDGQFVVRLC
jgi:hypothetical protein